MSTIESPVMALIPSDEETLLRESVAGIVSAFGPAYMRRLNAEGKPPTELWEALAEKGFMGVNIPEEYGGGGRGMTELCAVAEEISRGGCALLLMVVSPAIAGSILTKHGTPDQKDRFLRGIGSGELRCAFAVTEPDAGTNTHNISTWAKPDGAAYRINGQKTYISGVEDAHEILVVTRTDDGVGLFIVPPDAPGLTRQHIPTAPKSADFQWQLFFDDVVVEEDRRIPGALGALFDGLNPERLMAASLSLGTADRALTKAAQYANERVVWGKPIGTHQGLSHPLAQAKIELELARVMTQKACALYDGGYKGAGEAANMAKYAAAEAAIHAVDQAIQTHGGNGVADEYGLSDMWWGVRLGRIAPVSREMILNYVAEHSLGLPRSY
jgi:alkylation response protein AidB-like acyl-CoA dehydrogenase